MVLTVSQLMWCRDVTEILEGDFDRAEAMKEFETKNFQVGGGPDCYSLWTLVLMLLLLLLLLMLLLLLFIIIFLVN